MTNTKLSIIIVNWNAGELLLNCINSIIKSDINSDKIEIIVVDNDSSDNSLNNLPDQVILIRNKQNIGFGEACNIGFKYSKTKYKLLLNPDTEVLDNTLSQSITFMDNNPDVSILGAQHINEKGDVAPSCAKFPKPRNFVNYALGLSKLFPNIFHSATLMVYWDHKNSAYVDHVMGAYMFIRSSTIDKIGDMDPQFFVYFEDLDLSKRVSNNNLKSYYYTDISIYHKGRGTSDQVKDLRLFYSLRSRLFYAKKHYNLINSSFLFFFTLFIEPFSRLFFETLHLRFYNYINIINGYLKLYNYFLNPFSKRTK